MRKAIRTGWLGCFAMIVVAGTSALAQLSSSNLCYNADFTATPDPLDRWGINYDWSGSDKQIGNHKSISLLPEYHGRKNVLKIGVPASFESKFETPVMEFEPGSRYSCTFETCGDVGYRAMFLGYNFKPGMAPYDNPKHQDMRRLYKGTASEVGGSPSWKKVTLALPSEQVSELALKSLKKVRYMTVFAYVPGGCGTKGAFYISNMKIVKLSGGFKVKKEPAKAPTAE